MISGRTGRQRLRPEELLLRELESLELLPDDLERDGWLRSVARLSLLRLRTSVPPLLRLPFSCFRGATRGAGLVSVLDRCVLGAARPVLSRVRLGLVVPEFQIRVPLRRGSTGRMVRDSVPAGWRGVRTVAPLPGVRAPAGRSGVRTRVPRPTGSKAGFSVPLPETWR